MTDTREFENRFLAIIDRDGYCFVHEMRSKGHLVALLPFRRTGKTPEYLARRETCPAHAAHNAQPELCSITGGVDPEQTVLDAAQSELLEEAGYRASREEFRSLGTVKPSKAMDTLAHLFAIDVTDKVAQPPMGDGSRWEMGASVEWVDEQAGLRIDDPLFVTALARLKHMQL